MADETFQKLASSGSSETYVTVEGSRDKYPSIYFENHRNKSTDDLINNRREQNGPIQDHEVSELSSEESELPTENKTISKCLFYILVFMVILSSVIAIGAVVITLQQWKRCDDLERQIKSAHASYTSAQQDTHVCLPCSELMLGPFEEDNEELKTLIQKEENNTQICCAKTSQQISTLLNLFTKRKQLASCAEEAQNSSSTGSCNTTTEVGPPSGPSNAIVSAHLQVGIQSDSESEEQPIRNWRSDRPGTHVEHITISEDRLVVPETGLYFLYSQVGFLVTYDSQENIDRASQALFHKVFRYNHIYPLNGTQELLRSEVTQCWEKNKEYGRYTSYVGAAITLNKGDQLFVQVSRISLLSRIGSLSYFGLYKI